MHIVPGFIAPAFAAATHASAWHTESGAQSASALQASSEKAGARTPQRSPRGADDDALGVGSALTVELAEASAADVAADAEGAVPGATAPRRGGQAASASGSAPSRSAVARRERGAGRETGGRRATAAEHGAKERRGRITGR